MTYPAPAFDINGNLVTVDLEGGDYSNLPDGYYTTRGQAAVARAMQQSSGAAAPITAQEVYQIYSNPDADNQAAVQAVFDDPPPPSDYVAPTPPAAEGWIAPTPTPPPTAAQLVAQMYVDNGYTPPSDAIIHAIIDGTIAAPITDPLPAPAPSVTSPASGDQAASQPPTLDIISSAAQTAINPSHPMTAVDYAAQRPDLVVNWVRAHNPSWVAANPGAASVVQFIATFPTLASYLSNDLGSQLAGPDPAISPDVIALVASEVPTTAVTPTVVTPVVPNVPVQTTAGTNGGSTVSQFFDPTHRSIGWDSSGRENFIQIDEAGNIIAYASNGTNLRNLGAASQSAAATAAALLAQNPFKTNPLLNVGGSSNGGGGGSTGATSGQGNVNGGGSTGQQSQIGQGAITSPFFDPTHRSIGWDVHGKENFVQIDEAGNIIAYASDGTNLRNLGAATQSAAATAAALLAQNPFKTNPLNGAGTTVTTNPITGTTEDTSATSSSNVVLLVLGVAAIAFLAFRKN